MARLRGVLLIDSEFSMEKRSESQAFARLLTPSEWFPMLPL